MRVLVDGSIFRKECAENTLEVWRNAIPRLAECLNGHHIYFLNRGFVSRFPDGPNLKNLFAPPPDWKNSALEDRRLAALCRELDVTVFMSTYFTSAGTFVKSLFVATENTLAALRSANGRKQPLVLSAKRAENMACRRWIVPGSALETLPEFVGQLAVELSEVANCELSSQDNARRMAEERAVVAEVNLLAEIERQKTVAEHRDYHGPKTGPANALKRAYRGLTQPSRYGEFCRRALASIWNEQTTKNETN